jgi:hypothetical protein
LIRVGEKLREDLLVQFGSLLASNSELWPMGLSYLDFSKNYGIAHIEQILMAKDPETDGGVDALLAEARKRNLIHAG